MTGAEAMTVAADAVTHALALDVRTPDEMREAIRTLGEAVNAAVTAHTTILEEARALGLAERADMTEVDAMLGELGALWTETFGGGDASPDGGVPPMLAVRWDPPEPVPDRDLGSLEGRVHGLLDAWSTRTTAWAELAELERRSRGAMSALIARQRELRARFTAAQDAAPTLSVLEALRDELITILQAFASDHVTVSRDVIASARRRCSAALAEATALDAAHGSVPGFAERSARLVESLRLLRDAFGAADLR